MQRMGKTTRRVVEAATVITLLVSMSTASPVKYNFTGIVKEIANNTGRPDSMMLHARKGDNVSGWFSIDSVTGDPLGFGATIGDDTLTYAGNGETALFIANDYVDCCPAPPTTFDSIAVGSWNLVSSGEPENTFSTFLSIADRKDADIVWDDSLIYLQDLPLVTGDFLEDGVTRFILKSDIDRPYWAERPTIDITLDSLDLGYVKGDANRDGLVNAVDLNTIGTSWQQHGGWDQGDFTRDGFISTADLHQLAVNWGKGYPTVLVAVPEPSTITHLILLTLMGLFVWMKIGKR